LQFSSLPESSAMVPNGANLTYVGTWVTNSFTQTTNALLSAVSTDLVGVGIAVRNSDANQSLGNIILNVGVGGQFKVTLSLQVENGLGYGSVDDIISIIRGFVYQESGQYPLSDSIPYTQDDSGNTVPTGQPDTSRTPNKSEGCIAGSNNDLSGSFSVGCWFSNLTSSGLSTVGVLALIGIVGLILLSKAEHTVT
jgi:hypothetical protein